MGRAPERTGGAGGALPGAQGGSGAHERKTRSFGYSDGGQDEHAEDSTRRDSEAEEKGSAGTLESKNRDDLNGDGVRTQKLFAIVQLFKDLGLVIPLVGGHFSQHEAACGAERHF